MKILVAEDDKLPRKVLAKTLEKWGYEVIQAEDGAEAWELYQAEPTEMIISDWMMPHVDGLELCKRTRNMEHLPHHTTAPYTYFLLLTSRSDKESLLEAMAAGADDFMSKPFDEQELRWRIRAGERVIDLSGTLSNELQRADDYIRQINTQMTMDVQRLIDTLHAWNKDSSDGGDEGAIKSKLKAEVGDIVFNWVTSLDSVVSQ